MNKMVNNITENVFNSDIFMEPDNNLPTQENDQPLFMLNVNPLNDCHNEEDSSIMSYAPIPEAPSRSPPRSPNRSPNRSRSKIEYRGSCNSIDEAESKVRKNTN